MLYLSKSKSKAKITLITEIRKQIFCVPKSTREEEKRAIEQEAGRSQAIRAIATRKGKNSTSPETAESDASEGSTNLVRTKKFSLVCTSSRRRYVQAFPFGTYQIKDKVWVFVRCAPITEVRPGCSAPYSLYLRA